MDAGGSYVNGDHATAALDGATSRSFLADAVRAPHTLTRATAANAHFVKESTPLIARARASKSAARDRHRAREICLSNENMNRHSLSSAPSLPLASIALLRVMGNSRKPREVVLSRAMLAFIVVVALASFDAARASSASRRVKTRAVDDGVPAYVPVGVGDEPSAEFRVFLSLTDRSRSRVSYWHDVELYNDDGTVNFVCEIPQHTRAKNEMVKNETFNPIARNVWRNGTLRNWSRDTNWNYGFLPRTWEDPKKSNEALDAAGGDDDPVDVVEIGSRTLSVGSVTRAKVLGVYAMIDQGEIDWKIIAIASSDAMAEFVHDVDDVEKYFPGELANIKEWFRTYKIPDGKAANTFALDERCMNRAYAMGVIEETHEYYSALVSGERENDEGFWLGVPKTSDEFRPPPRRGRALKQFLAPVRSSMVGFRDALYDLGEALVDLSLVRRQYRWVDALNARAAELRAADDYEDDVVDEKSSTK